MNYDDNCCAGMDPTKETLTETVSQTEKQIYGITEIVEAIETILNGPVSCEKEGPRPNIPGVLSQSRQNLALLNNLSIRLSQIAERL